MTLKLSNSIGADWISNCGISAEKIARWEERREVERKTHGTGGTVEERLIYYSDFYDLATILRKRWSQDFAEVFGDWKDMNVYLKKLGDLRNPEAHRRELLPHQKHLAVGIAGEIRTRIVRFRSKEVSVDSYFPRIESVMDNYGKVWTAGSPPVSTGLILHPGDVLEFTIKAWDPKDEELDYCVLGGCLTPWTADPQIALAITEKDIASFFTAVIMIRSRRQYHAMRVAEMDVDHQVFFHYAVLPQMHIE